MPNPIRPDLGDLEVRLGLGKGDLTGTEKARADAALDDAAALVLAEVAAPTATRWEEDAPAVPRLVVLKAARREFENPRGLTTESLGEHSVGLSDSSGVYLTGREIAQVRRAASGRSGGFIGSIRTPAATE